MATLVTGISGMVGAHVVAELSRRGRDVIAVGRSAGLPVWVEHRAVTVLADLSRFEGELDCYAGQVEHVVHCAATSAPPDRSWATLVADNVHATENLLKWSVGAGVKRFVMLGAVSSYGEVTEPFVRAETPDNATDDYSRSKSLAEKALQAQSCGLRAIVVRVPGVLGRGATRAFLPRALTAVRRGDTIHASNPDALFNNAIHAKDLAFFIADLLDDPGWPAFDRLVVGATQPMTVRAILEQVVEAGGEHGGLQFDAAPRRPFLIDSSRAVDRYSYRPAPMATILRQWLNDE